MLTGCHHTARTCFGKGPGFPTCQRLKRKSTENKAPRKAVMQTVSGCIAGGRISAFISNTRKLKPGSCNSRNRTLTTRWSPQATGITAARSLRGKPLQDIVVVNLLLRFPAYIVAVRGYLAGAMHATLGSGAGASTCMTSTMHGHHQHILVQDQTAPIVRYTCLSSDQFGTRAEY